MYHKPQIGDVYIVHPESPNNYHIVILEVDDNYVRYQLLDTGFAGSIAYEDKDKFAYANVRLVV